MAVVYHSRMYTNAFDVMELPEKRVRFNRVRVCSPPLIPKRSHNETESTQATMMSNTKQENDEVADRDAEICMLVAMGFAIEHASEALDETGGDIDSAIDILVAEGGKSVKQGMDKKKSRMTRAGRHANSQSNDKKASSHTVATSLLLCKGNVKMKTDEPLGTVASSNESWSKKHVHQFDGIDGTIEKPPGK